MRRKKQELHGRTKGGQTKLYQRWAAIIQRCYNPKHPKYESYGGRGITMDPAWRSSFKTFEAEIPPRPSGKGWSLGRIHNDKGYYKENVRWETAQQQMRNTRTNRIVNVKGKEVVLQQLAEDSGLDHRLLRNRIERGMSPEEAVTRPREGGTIYLTIGEETHSLMVWCKKLGKNYQTVYSRMKRGITDHDQLFA